MDFVSKMYVETSFKSRGQKSYSCTPIFFCFFFLSYGVFSRKIHDKSWEKFQIVGEFARKTYISHGGGGYWRWSQGSTNVHRVHPLVKHDCGFKIERQRDISGRTEVVHQQTNGLAPTVLEPYSFHGANNPITQSCIDLQMHLWWPYTRGGIRRDKCNSVGKKKKSECIQIYITVYRVKPLI